MTSEEQQPTLSKVPKWWPESLRVWASDPVNNKKYAIFVKYFSLTIVTALVLRLGYQCYAVGEYDTLRSYMVLPSLVLSVLLIKEQTGLSPKSIFTLEYWQFWAVTCLSTSLYKLQKGRVADACAQIFCILLVFVIARCFSHNSREQVRNQDA